MIENTKKFTYSVLGHLCIVLALIGIFLPLLPTTPFVLLAAYFYSTGNTKFHRSLLKNKTFGPLIREWESHGIIRPKAKTFAVVMIVGLFSYTLIFVKVYFFIKIVVAMIGLGVIGFILTRPSNTGH